MQLKENIYKTKCKILIKSRESECWGNIHKLGDLERRKKGSRFNRMTC